MNLTLVFFNICFIRQRRQVGLLRLPHTYHEGGAGESGAGTGIRVDTHRIFRKPFRRVPNRQSRGNVEKLDRGQGSRTIVFFFLFPFIEKHTRGTFF